MVVIFFVFSSWIIYDLEKEHIQWLVIYALDSTVH